MMCTTVHYHSHKHTHYINTSMWWRWGGGGVEVGRDGVNVWWGGGGCVRGGWTVQCLLHDTFEVICK